MGFGVSLTGLTRSEWVQVVVMPRTVLAPAGALPADSGLSAAAPD